MPESVKNIFQRNKCSLCLQNILDHLRPSNQVYLNRISSPRYNGSISPSMPNVLKYFYETEFLIKSHSTLNLMLMNKW